VTNRSAKVLQEVAAARQILIICGSIEIDGYAFYLGVSRFYETYPELEMLGRSVTYLIKGAIFRPKHMSDSLGRASLNIRSLGELVDMFHTHKATQAVDKVYALLGMSSDNPSTPSLLPDYNVQWEALFKNLIKFVLSEQVYVKTWGNEERAILKSRGCVLGQVVSVHGDDRHKVNIVFKNMPEQLGCEKQWQAPCNLQASAKHVREGDVVCLLQGAQMPTIIRFCRDYFTIIRITVTLAGKPTGSRDVEWSDLLRSVITLPRDFLLIWTWEDSLSGPQETPEYETLVRMNNWVSEYSETDSRGHLERATRMWNVAMILDDLEEYDKAEKRLREAIQGYKRAFQLEHLLTPSSQHGRTPLSWASGNGYYIVVDALLEKDTIDPNLQDSQSGRSPLSWAAQRGHEAVVKLLLVKGIVEADSKDKHNQTPLSYASQNGHEAVVKLLLSTGKVKADSNDIWGRTPLSYASQNGHEAIVKLLLATGNVKADSKDGHNQTSLFPKVMWGRTPLSYASQNGHKAVVMLLLATGQVEADLKDTWGGAPLSYAAQNGHEAVIKLLLAIGKAEPDLKNKERRTSLSYAAQNGHEAVVILLLATGKVKADLKDENDMTPLSYAAQNGHEAVVKLLLATGKVEADSINKEGRTILSYTTQNGHEVVLKLLLATGKFETDFMDTWGRTPLSYAAQNGRKAVVTLLLATGKVEADLKDEHDMTPLSYAAQNGHEAVVKLLSEHIS
jgi:ankyrin repeat protein